ncbi:MAG: hypothetical protein H7210_03060 [Pyrinomonadaceae bacterium]|nr:hypothetical protein [Phycisphaerales bacterium]
MKTLWTILLLSAITGLISGCQYTPLEMNISPTAEMRANPAGMPTIKVDVVGLPAERVDQLRDADGRSWFAGSGDLSELRKQLMNQGLIKTFEFSQNAREAQILLRTDPLWSTFEKKRIGTVMIIADPPIAASNLSLWRQFIPVHKDTWVDDKVRITIGQGLYAETRVHASN